MLALDTRPPTDSKGKKDPALDAEDRVNRRDDIVCAFCESPITGVAHKMVQFGAHEHHFVNPAGRFFHVACFAQAAGCRTIGTATMLDTWFDGYTWRISLCATCQAHLGWLFERTNNIPFFGLIVERLIKRS